MAYHHGDLRDALVEAAVAAIDEDGVDRLSLRELARRTGVSHAAPAHHFGDRAGLFTAIAADGYRRLATRLRARFEASGGDFVEAGVEYVAFATEERARFEVMFRADLLRDDDPDLDEARTRAGEVLRAGAGGQDGDARANALAAWSIVHGFAMLWNAGAIVDPPDSDALVVARTVAARLFGRSGDDVVR